MRTDIATNSVAVRFVRLSALLFLFATVATAHAEMKLLLELKSQEYGWGHSGHASWGGNWGVRAKNEALEQIRTKIASMVNLKELETFTKKDLKKDLNLEGDKSGKAKIGLSDSKSNEEKLKWVNENNFLIEVSDVSIKPGTEYTRTRGGGPGRSRSWSASATMLYTLRIYGKENSPSPAGQ
jgi:hypothetical protein